MSSQTEQKKLKNPIKIKPKNPSTNTRNQQINFTKMKNENQSQFQINKKNINQIKNYNQIIQENQADYISQLRGIYTYYGKKNSQNKYSGQGQIIYEIQNKKYRIKGKFQNDEFSEGQIYENGQLVYKGKLKNNKKDGFGTQYFIKDPIIQKYVGNFLNDYREGSGKLYYRNQQIWSGFFKYNLKFGKFQIQKQLQRPIKKIQYYHNDILVTYQQSYQQSSGNFFIQNYYISKKSLQSLNKQELIYPNVIYAYGHLLEGNYNEWRKYNKGKKIRIFNKFWEILAGQKFDKNTKLNYQGVQQFNPMNNLQGLPLFSYYDILIFPIQIDFSHYSLILLEVDLDMNKPQLSTFTLSYLDSLRSKIQNDVLLIMKKYLIQDLKKYGKNKVKNELEKKIDKLQILNYEQLKLPIQNNLQDCGVWVCIYIKQILKKEKKKGKQINWQTYNQQKVDNMRNEIRDCIQGKLNKYF